MEKKNNNLVIILMGVIIVILAVLCALFATGVVSFNLGNELNKGEEKDLLINSEDKNELVDEVNDSYKISYEDEVYTTNNSEGKLSTSNRRNIVTVKNDKYSDAAKKIEDKLNEISNENFDYIKKSADEYKEIGYEVGVNYMMSTGLVNKNRLSFIFEQSGSFGGVGWSAINSANFDAVTGKYLTYDNITNRSSEFKKVLLDNLIKGVKKIDEDIKKTGDSGACLFEEGSNNWQDTIKKDFEKYDFIFRDSGIEIIIPKYEIACGAGGIFNITIDRNIVNEYLLDEYKI